MPNVTLLNDRMNNDWAEDLTATRISFPKLCAISEIVGAMRGLLEGGALDDMPLTKKSMQAALAKYEAAQ